MAEMHGRSPGYGVRRMILSNAYWTVRQPGDRQSRGFLDDTPKLCLVTKDEFNLSCFVFYPSSLHPPTSSTRHLHP